MNKEEIKKLTEYLSRYYDAASTPEEERELRRLIDDPSLPDDFTADREMMRHMDAVRLPEGFGERLAARVGEITRCDNQKPCGRQKRRHRQWLRYGAAASVVLVACVGLSLIPGDTQPKSALTPEETYAQVDKALTIFANSINRGYEEAYKAERLTESAATKALDALATISTNNNSKPE